MTANTGCLSSNFNLKFSCQNVFTCHGSQNGCSMEYSVVCTTLQIASYMDKKSLLLIYGKNPVYEREKCKACPIIYQKITYKR